MLSATGSTGKPANAVGSAPESINDIIEGEVKHAAPAHIALIVACGMSPHVPGTRPDLIARAASSKGGGPCMLRSGGSCVVCKSKVRSVFENAGCCTIYTNLQQTFNGTTEYLVFEPPSCRARRVLDALQLDAPGLMSGGSGVQRWGCIFGEFGVGGFFFVVLDCKAKMCISVHTMN